MELTKNQRHELDKLEDAGKRIEKLLDKSGLQENSYFPDPISFPNIDDNKKIAAGRQSDSRKKIDY